MASSRLHALAARGQSIWVDNLSRDLVHGGELARLIDEDAVTGITSNPTIFQKAIGGSSDYDEQLKSCAEEVDDPTEIFFRLAIKDVRDACDMLRPVWERTGGADGYVSLEVEPGLAYDTAGTFEQAISLHERVERANLYVKIPATAAGIPAIEDCIAAGRSINITLIFSLARYREVVDAYLRGLERLLEDGGDPAKVFSVASFFVSRIDTMPPETIELFQDHGEVRGDTVLEGWAEPEQLLAELERAGVDYDDVTQTLETEGVQKFSDSFDELLDGVRAKRAELARA